MPHMLRFGLPVNSSQKCTICRAQSISSFSYSFAQVSSSSQRVSCVETKASCSRKSEKQHNKQGWPSKPTALLPRAPERAAQKHPSIEITSGSLLLSLGALYQRNPLHPLGNERQIRTRCQETKVVSGGTF